MADECTNVSTVEELSLFCRWIENGEPTEHFIDLLPMKRTDAESIYSALVECLKSKNIQLSNLIGMGFDDAATFSGKKSGVQARMKKHSPHALFVHCHCHQIQLACVQAANGTAGIEHVCDANHIVEIPLLFTQACTITERSPESSRLPRIEDC